MCCIRSTHDALRSTRSTQVHTTLMSTPEQLQPQIFWKTSSQHNTQPTNNEQNLTTLSVSMDVKKSRSSSPRQWHLSRDERRRIMLEEECRRVRREAVAALTLKDLATTMQEHRKRRIEAAEQKEAGP
jgi:hypothetical protein